MTKQTQFRQGDVFITVATAIPTNAEPVAADPRGVVLAEGEATGHHHRVGPRFRNASIYRTDEATFLRVTGPAMPPSVAALVDRVNEAVSLTWAGLPSALAGADLDAAIAAVEVAGAVALDHEEHAPIRFAPGVYEVMIPREYTPEGVRQVVD